MFFYSRFKRSTQLMLLSSFVLIFQGSWAGLAFAGVIALQTPAGLQVGDQFRFIFVTPATTNATSSDITTYDSFVNQQANGATYNGQTIHWLAIGSTTTVDARVHAGLTNSGVFMANGTEIATSANIVPGGLWYGGSLLAQPIQDLGGNSYSGTVWTGTSGVGTEYKSTVNNVVIEWGLGTNAVATDTSIVYDNHIEVGQLQTNVSGDVWLSVGYADGLQLNTNQYQMYGISDVQTAVPEPSTLLISAMGVLVAGVSKWKSWRWRRMVPETAIPRIT